jgi:hypothetical protein
MRVFVSGRAHTLPAKQPDVVRLPGTLGPLQRPVCSSWIMPLKRSVKEEAMAWQWYLC